MNINVIVFNPLFESSKHGYDTIDYRKVDCRLGDNNSFKKICKALHDNDIKIMLDGVFNHVGRDFFAFKDVQRNLQNSRYCGWFQNLNFGGNSPKGDPFWYEGWAGHYDLVKLNLRNPEVVNHIFECIKGWEKASLIDKTDIFGAFSAKSEWHPTNGEFILIIADKINRTLCGHNKVANF